MRLTLVLAFSMTACAFGQATVKESLAKHWKTSATFTEAVAKAMPAESYSFRPTPEEMSFGQLMTHIAVANVGACALAGGLPRPTAPEKIAAWLKDQKSEVEKDTAVAFLADSFAFCLKAVDAAGPDKLDKVVGPAARAMTGFEWFWSYFTHTAHHRGQAEVYLRMKGIKPPEYQF